MRGSISEIDIHNLNEEQEAKIILNKFRTIAVVGCSRDPRKDAQSVPKFMKENGYRIVPVNPNADMLLGEKCYPGLLQIPDSIAKNIEVVDVFRPSEEAVDVVKQAVDLKVRFGKLKAVWLQQGIASKQAADLARKYGLLIVMDKCMRTEYRKMWD
jgi:hypothetical protein